MKRPRLAVVLVALDAFLWLAQAVGGIVQASPEKSGNSEKWEKSEKFARSARSASGPKAIALRHDSRGESLCVGAQYAGALVEFVPPWDWRPA